MLSSPLEKGLKIHLNKLALPTDASVVLGKTDEHLKCLQTERLTDGHTDGRRTTDDQESSLIVQVS